MISINWLVVVCFVGSFFLPLRTAMPTENVTPVEEDNTIEEDNSIYDKIENLNKKSSKELFEGDIVITPVVKDLTDKTKSANAKRDSKRYLAALWRTRIIPYEISTDFPSAGDRNAITNALKIFEAKTCLKFTPHTTESNWIKFEKKDGCFSAVGREYYKTGSQTVSLGVGCMGQSTILHEVMHALGFWHEQSRPDRDKFVEIFWENIDPDNAYNFNKYSHQHADVLGVNYDYQTLMHYGKKAFSMNGKNTMQAVGNSALELGQSNTLSASDVTQLNALYDCANAGVSIWSTWSGYGPCDTVCYKSRHRFCSHANLTLCKSANQYGIETQYLQCSQAECNAPIDGHWGRWSAWGPCSKDCGAAKKNRTRTCSDPAPKNGGKSCVGASISHMDCFVKSCGLGKFDCEFDGQGWCFWKADPNNLAKYTWDRISGRTPSSRTGPTTDHTSSAGSYLYAEASSPAYRNDVARLVSGELPASKTVCLSFWYHMYGMTMGGLKVFVKEGNDTEKEVWGKSGDQGDQWLNSNKTITSKKPYKVIFQATNGAGYLSDMALDDIFFKEGSCEKSKIQLLCNSNMKPLGCFKDSYYARSLSTFVASYRDGIRSDGIIIDWHNYQQSINSMLCHCGKKAKEGGFKYFGLQYYGECWAGNNSDFSKHGVSKNCVNGLYQECSVAEDKACSGKGGANYMYELF